MNKKILFILILTIVFISACSNLKKQDIKEEVKEVCKSPYFEFKVGECCLDDNGNSICDKDEDYNKEIQNKGDGVKDFLEGKAVLFASLWEVEDYESLYSYFTPELKSKKTKEEFVRILNFTRGDLKEPLSVRLDDIKIVDEKNALVYYRITGNSLFIDKTELPAFPIIFVDGDWKFNTLNNIFDAECVFDYDLPYLSECKTECESKDINKFGYLSCNNFKMGCSCVSTDFKNSCKMRRAGEFEKNKEIMCQRFVDSRKELAMQFRDFNGTLIFKNMEEFPLTNMVITINGDYTLEVDTIPAKSEYSITKTNLISETGRSLREGASINTLYVYSDEGKYGRGMRIMDLGRKLNEIQP